MSADNNQSLAKELFEETRSYFFRPFDVIRGFRAENIRFDLLAGLTVAVVMLPQAMAYALIAELPPQIGINSVIVASVVGVLWGSSRFLHTGPTNAASLLVLSTLLTVAAPGTPEYLAAAGVMAVMVGLIRLFMGLARMGVLVNFVADSVVVGFTAGAGILICINQLQHVLKIEIEPTPLFFQTLDELFRSNDPIHWSSLIIGLGTILAMLVIKRLRSSWPDALIAIVVMTLISGILRLEQRGVVVVGTVPGGLPPIANLPLLDIHLIRNLATGALAVAVIGLVEAMSIARAITAKSGDRIDANQEFVGQGLANIAAGLYSGYTCSGSFTRTAVNYASGARSAMSVVFAAVFVVAIIWILAPAAAIIPRATLAGLLIVIGIRLVDVKKIASVWRISRGDSVIMIATFAATLLLPLEFAVLTGILVSFGRHLVDTSRPEVQTLLPDENYKELIHLPEKPECPQLGVLTIRGSLYFGATVHVEDEVRKHVEANPAQNYLLLHMQQVNRCDVSGLRMLETLVDQTRRRGGDLYLTGVHQAVWQRMKLGGFDRLLGHDHFLTEDMAIEHLFYMVLDPAICIYKCPLKVWSQCQTLPKSDRLVGIVDLPDAQEIPATLRIAPAALWEILGSDQVNRPVVIDVRERPEYERGHIPDVELRPMPELLSPDAELPNDRDVVLVCRTGRRSSRVIVALRRRGLNRIRMVDGGMIAWREAGLPQVIE